MKGKRSAPTRSKHPDHRPGRYVSKRRAWARGMAQGYAEKCGPVTTRQMTAEERARYGLPPQEDAAP